ncbi:hypothetical protein ACI2OX_20690 [Bacillus sp. N9]
MAITAFTTGFAIYDLSMLWYMVAGGIIGGFVGASLTERITNRQIDRIFVLTLLGIILLNIYNIIRNLV